MNSTNVGSIEKEDQNTSEMEHAFDSLFVELGSLNDYITSLENKLIPVINPTGEGKQGGSPASPIAPEAPYLAQLRNARSSVMNMSARLEKLRDNVVV